MFLLIHVRITHILIQLDVFYSFRWDFLQTAYYHLQSTKRKARDCLYWWYSRTRMCSEYFWS